MTTEAPGIDDVAPATGNDGVDLTTKADLENVPLLITAVRNIAKGSNGPWVKVLATRLDTAELVAFSGGTVLDQQLEQVKAANVLPPDGPGVRAMLVMERPEGGGNNYWRFATPEGGSNGSAPAQAATSNRAAEVRRFIEQFTIPVENVREFVDSLNKGAKVDDLSDEDYGTLVEWLKGHDAEPPF